MYVRYVPSSNEKKGTMFYEISTTDGSTIRRVRCRLLDRRDRLFDHSEVFLSCLSLHCNILWMFYIHNLINNI